MFLLLRRLCFQCSESARRSPRHGPLDHGSDAKCRRSRNRLLPQPLAAAAEAPATVAPCYRRRRRQRRRKHRPLHSGNIAWMLTSSALVLFMTAPGLAMFYGGLVRKKNVLSVLMQCVFLMGLMTCIWGRHGYSFAFSGANPHRSFDKVFLKGSSRVKGSPYFARAGKRTESRNCCSWHSRGCSSSSRRA